MKKGLRNFIVCLFGSLLFCFFTVITFKCFTIMTGWAALLFWVIAMIISIIINAKLFIRLNEFLEEKWIEKVKNNGFSTYALVTNIYYTKKGSQPDLHIVKSDNSIELCFNIIGAEQNDNYRIGDFLKVKYFDGDIYIEKKVHQMEANPLLFKIYDMINKGL